MRRYLWSAALVCALQGMAHAQTISFTGTPLSQNFDGMGPTGTNTPAGWFVGSNAATVINYTTNVTVSAGAVASSPTIRGFNFGTSNAAERALGTAPTASDRFIEARIRNNTIFSVNMITVGYLIVRGAMFRKESRGLHFNTDYPFKSEMVQNIVL